MRDWWHSLSTQPQPLTPRERMLVVALTIVTAITRWFALAASPWDWDEMLFMLGMRHFDVAAHHPHPPGFPLFIAPADLLHRLGISDYRSLQAITFAGALAIVPAAFFFFREMRASFPTALIASALLAFFPNVWFYGGTAFSDVPSMTLLLIAAALLLRGCRDLRALDAGAIVLAIASGIRPQNLMIGFVPAVIALAYQGWKRTMPAIVIGAVIVGASYGAAAELTGIDRYEQALRAHQQYIVTIDSFRSPTRPHLQFLFDDFFLRPYRQPAINIAISLLVAVSGIAALIRIRPEPLMMLAIFGPFCLLAYLDLDFHSVSRFSIAYCRLLAFLAADGLMLITRNHAAVSTAIACVLVAGMAAWATPAIREIHVRTPPPIVAMQYVAARSPHTFVHESMRPFAEEYLSDFEVEVGRNPPAVFPADRRDLFIAEELPDKKVTAPVQQRFTWPHDALFEIARQRYFDVAVAPLQPITFGSGWYAEEGSGAHAWRWMGAHSVTTLPPAPAPARLTLDLSVPLKALGRPPLISITFNGRVIDHIRMTNADVERSYTVAAAGPATLVIDTDGVAHVGTDTRELGVQLMRLEWASMMVP